MCLGSLLNCDTVAALQVPEGGGLVGVGVSSRIEITVMIVVMVMASGEIISAESIVFN